MVNQPLQTVPAEVAEQLVHALLGVEPAGVELPQRAREGDQGDQCGEGHRVGKGEAAEEVVHWISPAVEEHHCSVERDEDVGGEAAEDAQQGEADQLQRLVGVLQAKVGLEDVRDALLEGEPDGEQAPEEGAYSGGEEALEEEKEFGGVSKFF